MSNFFLYISAIVNGALQCFVLWCCRDFAKMIDAGLILAPIVTSIWNHGTTSSVAKVADRVAVCSLAFFYLVASEAYWMFCCIIVSASLYIFSKILRCTTRSAKGRENESISVLANILHSMSHVCQTFFTMGWLHQRLLSNE
jgi:hypothetical protein